VDDKKDLARLLDEIINKLESISASYYELRVLKCVDLVSRDRLKCHNYYKTHILDLEGGFEKVKQAFHKDSVVCTVKKAVKCQVKIREALSEQDLRKFYSILAITRKRHGFPIQPYRFFKNMWEILYPQGYFTLLLAELNRIAIAGLVLFKFKDTISLEHIGSIPKYLLTRPNHLLLWRAIEVACSQGYGYCDFGKTPPENKGLLNFKSRWGAKIYDLPYFYYPKIKGAMSLEQNDLRHRLLRYIGKCTPLPVAKIMGGIAYHHLG
jgi:lipid II:glycine glycyltransferase (peptidoglycan interpeptide bridge formation enzyme)